MLFIRSIIPSKVDRTAFKPTGLGAYVRVGHNRAMRYTLCMGVRLELCATIRIGVMVNVRVKVIVIL